MEPQQSHVPVSPDPSHAPQPQMTPVNPGQTLGVVSLVTSLLGISLVGLITGIIGMKKSKDAGMSNGLALAGVIISAIGMVLGLLWFLFVMLAIMADA